MGTVPDPFFNYQITSEIDYGTVANSLTDGTHSAETRKSVTQCE